MIHPVHFVSLFGLPMYHYLLTAPMMLFVLLSPAALVATERFEFEEGHLGTLVRIILYTSSPEVAEKAAQEAFDSFRTVNDTMNTYDSSSELSQLHENRGMTRVSDDLFTVLLAAKHYSTISDGAFDITVAPMVRLWRRSSRQQELPSERLLEQAKELVGNHLWELDERTQSVRLLKAGMRLDLSGIAKGYAIDRAFEIIQKHGITSLLIDAGGDFRVGASPPCTDGWRIVKGTETVFLKDTAMATSGGSVQFVEIDGVRYSHLIDPKTGLGITGFQKVHITAPTAMKADALATAVSILGEEEGKAMINKLSKVSMKISGEPCPQ